VSRVYKINGVERGAKGIIYLKNNNGREITTDFKRATRFLAKVSGSADRPAVSHP
jgi:hypothetical protein